MRSHTPHAAAYLTVLALGLAGAIAGLRAHRPSPPAQSPAPGGSQATASPPAPRRLPAGCSQVDSVCGVTVRCGARWSQLNPEGQVDTECTLGLEAVLRAVAELEDDPWPGVPTADERPDEQRARWSVCGQTFSTPMATYRTIVERLEIEQRAFTGGAIPRVELSRVVFGCQDNARGAFFVDLFGYVETFSTPYRGLWRHDGARTTRVWERGRTGNDSPSELWRIGDLDGNGTEEYVIYEEGRYDIVDVHDGRGRTIYRSELVQAPRVFRDGGDDAIVVIGRTLKGYRDGRVIDPPPEAVRDIERRVAESRASLSSLRAALRKPVRYVSDSCSFVRLGWATRLTRELGWSRGTLQFEPIAGGIERIANSLPCTHPGRDLDAVARGGAPSSP